MGLFDNREIAIAIWMGLLVAWVLYAARRSDAPLRLLKAFAQKQILTSLGLMALYIGLMVFGLLKVGLWDIGQLKNTIIWIVSVAGVSLFSINSIIDDAHYYRKAIKETLGLTAVLEFVIGSFTFDLWAELLIVPFTAMLAGMLVIAERKKEHARIARILSVALSLFGLFVILHAAYRLVVDFRPFATMQTLSDFYLPPVLSLLYLPFIFIVALYVHYENAFLRLRFALKDDPKLRAYAKRRAVIGFRVRTGLLKRWTRNLNIEAPKNKREIDQLIREIKILSTRESNPPGVPLERGWSPYLACEFLAADGLQPSDYHRGFDGEWWASSPYLEIDEAAIIHSNIAYYIEGDEFAATTLRLVLNVNEPQSAQEAREQFTGFARKLFHRALNHVLPGEVERLLSSETADSLRLHDKEIVVAKELWPQHRLDGYEIAFTIRNPEARVPGASG